MQTLPRTTSVIEFGTKTLRHPEVEDLTPAWDTFRSTGDSDQQLVLWSAEAGSTSHEKLRILTSWTAPLPHAFNSWRPAARRASLRSRSSDRANSHGRQRDSRLLRPMRGLPLPRVRLAADTPLFGWQHATRDHRDLWTAVRLARTRIADEDDPPTRFRPMKE
ncbi:hypothetical protein IU450_25295 [Nocardia abscessus]|uniref:MmyB family transcriptional regulator n=1 Tax=Nocardia abscessus TaxID=120957 RepID=UPI00189551EF|nr:hypothetical protein [Nocardia abscessus]MBF6339183.1 hypothetical protein [Nocardia abscessus]